MDAVSFIAFSMPLRAEVFTGSVKTTMIGIATPTEAPSDGMIESSSIAGGGGVGVGVRVGVGLGESDAPALVDGSGTPEVGPPSVAPPVGAGWEVAVAAFPPAV
ncbi:hypothetical protein GCM10011575_07320 [Microlunatus endophyticus]|uniref:Uncharacterized protein n=1 Tax=Microlunatus endophyticus TaxID=1716077 RepID=A0A917W1N1_9ACTN|nr:hypothetical protein GCM10011575_07320 [Microlunatus endophyticus]